VPALADHKNHAWLCASGHDYAGATTHYFRHEGAFTTPAPITFIHAYGPRLSSCTSRRPKGADGAPAARPPSGGGPSGLLAAQPARPVHRQVNTAPGERVQRCEDS